MIPVLYTNRNKISSISGIVISPQPDGPSVMNVRIKYHKTILNIFYIISTCFILISRQNVFFERNSDSHCAICFE